MRASVQGGKEEIRASFLTTYLLRLRAEKGDDAVKQLLEHEDVDSAAVRQERSWLSIVTAARILNALREALGADALQERGDWVTHPESLGTMVRMLRAAKSPREAYRYIADNAKELSRIGAWECDAEAGSAPQMKLVYMPRTDGDEPVSIANASEEALFCAARIGELASIPRLWGMPSATVIHTECLAKKHASCVYEVRWVEPGRRALRYVYAASGGALLGVAVGLAGTPLTGMVGAAVGALGGFFAGSLAETSASEVSMRTFEKHRITALERGLELKGELEQAPAGELAGTVLGGKYKIGRKIGSGGIGVVYAAEHTALGHEVAVKVLRGAAARDGSEIARLRREAHIQTHVDHPNVARVLDLDQMPDGSIYVVMERLLGKSLADKLQREIIVAPGFAIPVFIDVCRGLAAAHAKGVVHRDLKPGNVFLCEDGSAKVLDFGMSKLTNAEALTQQGYTLGTPEYMAPEQCIGGAVEPRTDLYALGVLMYESLTGELPIRSNNRRDLLDLHQRKVPDRLLVLRPDLPIPLGLENAIMRCLEKKPNDRPASAVELAQMLSDIPLAGLPKAYKPGIARKTRVPSSADDSPDVVTNALRSPAMDAETMGALVPEPVSAVKTEST